MFWVSHLGEIKGNSYFLTGEESILSKNKNSSKKSNPNQKNRNKDGRKTKDLERHWKRFEIFPIHRQALDSSLGAEAGNNRYKTEIWLAWVPLSGGLSPISLLWPSWHEEPFKPCLADAVFLPGGVWTMCPVHITVHFVCWQVARCPEAFSPIPSFLPQLKNFLSLPPCEKSLVLTRINTISVN